jgi:hypothetical protein
MPLGSSAATGAGSRVSWWSCSPFDKNENNQGGWFLAKDEGAIGCLQLGAIGTCRMSRIRNSQRFARSAQGGKNAESCLFILGAVSTVK